MWTFFPGAINSLERGKLAKSQNYHISLDWPLIEKNKCTFLSSTFKVEENKVALFFGFYIIWVSCELLVICDLWEVDENKVS